MPEVRIRPGRCHGGKKRELAYRTRQLEAQRTELERASRMKSEFLAIMSHELRTPVNAMLGYNSLLREGLFGKPTERQEDALKRMHDAAGHLLSLINDILDLSTVEAGHVELRPAEPGLEEFLSTISEDILPLAAAKSLEYRLEVPQDVPKVVADGTRLRQVLFYLLSNAVKFTESGTVTVRAFGTLHSGREHIRLEVEDTGIGIAPEDIQVIFQEFRKVDQSVARQHKGTGLGLAISRKLILLMGGHLGVRSERGAGSTFYLELPTVPVTEEPTDLPEEPVTAS